MKKIFSLITMFLLCLCSMGAETATTLFENYHLYVVGENGRVGSSAELYLCMKNQTPINIWTCDVVLPEGVTCRDVTIYDAGGRYPEGYNAQLSYSVNNDGSVNISCSGEEGVGLELKDGAVAVISVDIDESVDEGEYEVIVKNSYFVEPDGHIYQFGQYDFDKRFHWVIEEATWYVVTFRFYQDGEQWDQVQDEVHAGDPIPVPSDIPTREGYDFDGWDPEVPDVMPAQDMTFTAKWKAHTHDVIYYVDNEEYRRVTLEYGAPIELIDEPTKEGYNFSGWSQVPLEMPDADVEVFGSFEVIYYGTEFYLFEGGALYEGQEVAYGEPLIVPNDPEGDDVPEGYSFDGWDPEIPETMPAHDMTFIAKWKVNTYKLYYYIDNDLYYTDEIEYGATITPQAAPEREGYTFEGWLNMPEELTMPASDVYVSANYTVNTYELILLDAEDGSQIESMSLDYGDDIVATIQEIFQTLPEREGYTFTGWGNVPEDGKMPASNLTVWMEWEVNKYTLAFIVDNDVIWSGDVEYGAPIVVPDVPEKEGFVFDGWNQEIPETMPAGELIIYGSYKAVAEFITLSQQYATFCADHSLDFTNSDLKAYIATGYISSLNYVVLEEIKEVPAGTGVFLVGEAGKEYMVPFAAFNDMPVVEGNLFVGVLQQTYVFPTDDAGNSNYVFGERDNQPAEDAAFYIVWTPNGAILPAQTAYLQVKFNGQEPVEQVRFGFLDTADGISGIQQNAGENAIFDLQGRRVSKTGKGVYIIGGKKVAFK